MNAGHRVLMVLLCAVCAHALPARAMLISAGSPVTFNVDFTGTGAYTVVGAGFSGTGLDSGEVLFVTFFDNPNAGGPSNSTGVVGPGAGPSGAFALPSFLISTPGLLDGQFSVQASVTGGSVNVASLTVFTTNGFGFPPIPVASRTLISNAVPEPATLALVGLGLAGLAVTRRRRSN